MTSNTPKNMLATCTVYLLIETNDIEFSRICYRKPKHTVTRAKKVNNFKKPTFICKVGCEL